MRGDTEQLRVVVFTGGGVLQEDCVEFMALLDSRPEVELAGVFCECRAPGRKGIALDLWRRRRGLAPLLLLQRLLRTALGRIIAPRATAARRRLLHRLEGRIHYEPDLHAGHVLACVADLKPHLGTVYGGPILRPELFDIPRMGTLGIHHGLLPHYRGKKTTFWAMYNGEDRVGVAIQRIGTGLDRGAILRSAALPTRRMPLPIVRRKLERLGFRLYLEAVLCMREGNPDFVPQPAGGTLYKDPRAGDILRFWWRYAARLLRGTGVRGPET